MCLSAPLLPGVTPNDRHSSGAVTETRGRERPALSRALIGASHDRTKYDWSGENDGLGKSQWIHWGLERLGFCLAIGWDCKLTN